MRIRLSTLSVFTVLALQTLASGVASAETWQPKPQQQRVVWNDSRGVLKDFTLAYLPSINQGPDSVSVIIHERIRKDVDRFAGVHGEMVFSPPSTIVHTTLYFADGSSATGREGRASAAATDVVGIRTRHFIAGRTWEHTWSNLPRLEDLESLDNAGQSRLNSRLQSSRGVATLWVDMNRDEFEIIAWDNPNLDLYLQALDKRRASEAALEESREALKRLAETGDTLDRAEAQETTARFLKAAAELDREGPERPDLVYETAKQMQRLNNAGLGIEEYFKHRYGTEDPEALRFVAKVLAYGKAGLTAKQMRDEGEVNAKRFVDDAVALIPSNHAPALQGPVGVFFRDLLDWDQKMWSASTDGLRLVADAMESGSLDHDAAEALGHRLNRLGDEGPWGTDSGQSFGKKLVGGVPVVGKLLSAIW